VISVSMSGSACQATLSIRNNRTYWTNFTLSTLGTATAVPVGGDSNGYAHLGLLPPVSLFPPLPATSVDYYVTFSRPGDGISVLTNPTIDGGIAAPMMNGVQALLNVLPHGDLATVSIDKYQTISTAFQQMPHLTRATTALFSNHPKLWQFVTEFTAYVKSRTEPEIFAAMVADLGYTLEVQVITATFEEYLKNPYKLALTLFNAIGTSVGNVIAVFQDAAGSVKVIAQ
jgi:hypothetical protein